MMKVGESACVDASEIVILPDMEMVLPIETPIEYRGLVEDGIVRTKRYFTTEIYIPSGSGQVVITRDDAGVSLSLKELKLAGHKFTRQRVRDGRETLLVTLTE